MVRILLLQLNGIIRMDTRYIEEKLSNTMLDRPITFELHNRFFYVYPQSLGKTLLVARMLNNIGMNKELLTINSQLAMLTLVEEKKRDVCRLIALLVARTKEEIFSETFIRQTAKYIQRHTPNEDLASLLTMAISRDDVDAYIEHLGIDKEQERMQAVLRAKNDSSTYSFGCKSLYGRIIDRACERYGWSYDYVMWGISYANLQMLLADQGQTVYLTDDERKKVCIAPDRSEVLRADDPKNIERIKAMSWS